MSVTLVRLGGRPDRPLLVLGPSLGTSVTALWSAAAAELAADFQVVGWDLPGHGTNPAAPTDRTTVASLAVDVLDAVDALGTGIQPPVFHYAGDSVGGAVGLQLLLDVPERVHSATLLCSGAKIGTAESWQERIDAVRSAGTPSLVTASAQRWFGPGFVDREPAAASALLHALSDADDEGYAAVCGALAAHDLRDRLGSVHGRVLAVAGSHDVATPPATVREIAEGVPGARYVELPGVAHLAPIEAPDVVARLVREHALGVRSRDDLTVGEVRAAGLEVRRAVLGDGHVDRATAAATDLTQEFQDFITEYAWGGIWTRPGLDRRTRSLLTITALVARGHHEELAMHLRAARRNGVTVEEIKETLLQAAIYCGVPDANTAFRIAQRTFAEPGDEGA
jgi:3-oxoadipate enol-lactonase/4-carboxymuconolactone decarboxylase